MLKVEKPQFYGLEPISLPETELDFFRACAPKKVFFLYYNIFFNKSQVPDRAPGRGGGGCFREVSIWRHMPLV
jgi:hypothetical protein